MIKTALIAAATAAIALSGAGMANAQQTGVYGSVGYQNTGNDKLGSNLGSVNLRLGDRITPHFGVEGETAFGTSTDRNDAGYKNKLTNKTALYGVGYVPVSPNFDLIGRVGVSDTNLKSPSANKIEEGTALDYGVGAQYHLSSDYALRADLTKSDFNGDKGSATTTSINLVKKF